MRKESFELKQGIKAHIIHTDYFKTNIVCIMITVPLTRECVTKNALLPSILRRGTKNYPDQYVLNKELENMYGATFDCGIDKTGDNQILKFYIDTINNDYTLEHENILAKSIQILFDIVCNPVLENRKFKEEFLRVEKENLKRIIESKIDSKDAYALNNCIANMYGENGFGLYKYGYVEDVDHITTEELTNYYHQLIQNSKMDIFLSGNFEKETVLEILKTNDNLAKLEPREGKYILNNFSTEKKQKVENIKEIQEKLDVTQGKLVMGFDVLAQMDNLYASALVYNTILGDGANSMLFQNVREKEGLAYSARSSFVKQKLNIFIRCGIQIENYDKAVSVIKEQLEDIKNGRFTEEQIQDAKTYLISGIKCIEEEQDTEIVYYFEQEITKQGVEIEEYIRRIKSVTREDILKVANSIQLNTQYFLTAK